MTYEQADRYVVLFGGFTPSGVALNDTWEFVAGRSTPNATTAPPNACGYAAMTYDAADG
jgi:Galactose oxidase, central domain